MIIFKYLDSDTRIAVQWWWPAWAFCATMLKKVVDGKNLSIQVDVYEQALHQNKWCNWCWWVVSPWAMNILTEEGIAIPDDIILNRLKWYVVHTDFWEAVLDYSEWSEQPATVFRWWWPRKSKREFLSLNKFLLDQAIMRWVNVIREKIISNSLWGDWSVNIITNVSEHPWYSATVWATWKVAKSRRLPGDIVSDFKKAKTEKTYCVEIFYNGKAWEVLKDRMHVFLLDWKIRQSALIPKWDDYATLVIVWDINREELFAYINQPTIKRMLPEQFEPNENFIHCDCRSETVIWTTRFLNKSAKFIPIWDAWVSRLYKDWISSALLQAKNAARSVLEQWEWENFCLSYLGQVYKEQSADNLIWSWIFTATNKLRRMKIFREYIIKFLKLESMLPDEQQIVTKILFELLSWQKKYSAIIKQFPKLLYHIPHLMERLIIESSKWFSAKQYIINTRKRLAFLMR